MSLIIIAKKTTRNNRKNEFTENLHRKRSAELRATAKYGMMHKT